MIQKKALGQKEVAHLNHRALHLTESQCITDLEWYESSQFKMAQLEVVFTYFELATDV